MFGLSHLFYPWGFIVQIFAIVHFVRRRPENYWFFVIFFGGFLGAGVYIVAEVLPDLGLLRGVFQGFGRKSRNIASKGLSFPASLLDAILTRLSVNSDSKGLKFTWRSHHAYAVGGSLSQKE